MISIPSLNYKHIVLNAPILNAVSGNNNQTPTNVTRKDTDELVRNMLMTNKFTIFDKDPEEKFGGSPVRQSFFLVIHPDLVSWFILVPGFISADFYPNQRAKVKGELGAVGNLRLIVDNTIPREIRIDHDYIYNCLCFGGEHDKPEDFINFRVTKEE